MTIEPIKEKLDDKIAKLNSSRVIKKITPRGDLSWYIKWVSSMFIIFAMATASADMYPYNLFLQFIGLVGWLVVGMLWHDRALILLNSVAIFIFASGIVNYYYG